MHFCSSYPADSSGRFCLLTSRFCLYAHQMNTKQLKPNPKNPRTISPTKLAALKRTLAEFGDLGGIVYNQKSKQVVGGHQRLSALGDYKIIIEIKYKKPTAVGTVAEGHILAGGEKFRYREVAWDDIKEKAAAIAANKNAGEWNFPELSDWFKDLNEFGFDLSLTLFDDSELKGYLSEDNKKAGKNVEFTAKDFDGLKHKCPKCGFGFND